jgi:hypothetical protein
MEAIQWISGIAFIIFAFFYIMNGFMWNQGFRTGDLGDLITKKSYRHGQTLNLKIMLVCLIIFVLSILTKF